MRKGKELRILHLTLHKAAFDAIADGYKKEEYRKPSNWIRSRLLGKEYNAILFVNGYGKHRPWMLMEFKGYFIKKGNPDWVEYPNKLQVKIEPGDFVIKIGRRIDADYSKREIGKKTRPDKFFATS